jgi:transcriptional regulator with XRE-family HTH domain
MANRQTGVNPLAIVGGNCLPSKELRRILAVWLKQGMERAGLNQSSLARKSLVSRDTIWRVLHEKTGVTEERLVMLSDAIGQPLPVLSDISHQMPPAQPQRPGEPRKGDEVPSGGVTPLRLVREAGWLLRLAADLMASTSSDGASVWPEAAEQIERAKEERRRRPPAAKPVPRKRRES